MSDTCRSRQTRFTVNSSLTAYDSKGIAKIAQLSLFFRKTVTIANKETLAKKTIVIPLLSNYWQAIS